MSDDRPNVYEENGTWVYRASSVGLPVRCLSAARQGYDPLPAPDYLLAAAEAGNRSEVIVKAQMRVDGWKVSGEQGEIEFTVVPGVVIRGHLDALHAIAPDSPEDRILEVKSMSNRVYSEWMTWSFEKFPTYAAQVSTYMAAKQSEAVYAALNRDTLELDIRILRDYPWPIHEIIDRVILVEEQANKGILPPCTGFKYQCPWDYMCDANLPQFEEVEAGTEDMLVSLGSSYTHLLDLEADLKSRKEELRREIRDALGGHSEVQVPGFSFHQKPRTSRKLNTTRLRADMGDALDDYYEEKVSDPVLTIHRKAST